MRNTAATIGSLDEVDSGLMRANVPPEHNSCLRPQMGDTEPARAKNCQNVIPLPARRNQWANSTPLIADNFSDEVFQDDVLVGQAPSRMRAMVVSFTPGARTAWHADPVRQTSIA